MEAALWEVSSVLLELQTTMIDNYVSVASEDLSTEFSRQQLTTKVKRLMAEVASACEENRPLIVQMEENGSTRRMKLTSGRARKIIALVLEKIYRLLLTRTTASRREIYYQNVKFYKSQRSVDLAVSRICQTLDIPQWNLGVLSTSKGLVFGPLVIKLKSGELIDCSQQQGGTLIPQALPYGASYESDAQFALIIEKDAAFQSLLSSGLRTPLNYCILITGKGYPDMNTRFLVKELTQKLSLPTFAVVDGDPHGIDIFFNYKYGSMGKSYISRHLAAPDVLWLGVHPTDIVALALTSVQPLTNSDLRKAKLLLTRPYVQSDELLKEQILHLIERKVKCEIENISSIANHYLGDVYIPSKISLRKFI